MKINLLPKEQKEELKIREDLIVAIHLGSLVLFSFFCFVVNLLALNLVFEGKLKAMDILYQTQLKTLDLKAEEEIKKENKILEEIWQFQKNKKELLPILIQISEILPEKVFLKNISLQKVKDEIVITASGKAQERESLLLFKNLLEENFKEVFLPPEIWFKEKDIEFSVSFKAK